MTPLNEYPFDDENLQIIPKKLIPKIQANGLEKYLRNDKLNIQQIYFDHFKSKKIDNPDQLVSIFQKWTEEGIKVNDYEFIESKDYESWLGEIDLISNSLYANFPDYFFPYFYTHNFDKFQLICNLYNISLPDIPKKKDKIGRLLYYVRICISLNEFKQINELSPQELCAFFYDFAPQTLDDELQEENEELPNPSKVWYVGAGGKDDFDFLDNANESDFSFWQCNLDTRPGDIILVYCWSPRSLIHSVWRATTNGFYDPFFYYYRLAYISKPIKVPPISYKEIISNPILSRNPLTNNRFQGVNGYPVTSAEYQEMLRLWESKGMNISKLPKLEKINILPENINLHDERDIEIHLVEPFLKKMGFKETDWIRQMPIKMGRGVSYYPDYCINANTKRGDEKAKMVLEAKFSIKNSKELKKAFFQAKSYAIRLQTNCFILAAKEGLWFYYNKNYNYKIDDVEHYSWNELENNDLFHEIKIKIEKLNKKTVANKL